LTATYANLLYACHSCNLKKGGVMLPKAEHHLNSDSIRVALDGRLVGFTSEAGRLIEIDDAQFSAMGAVATVVVAYH